MSPLIPSLYAVRRCPDAGVYDWNQCQAILSRHRYTEMRPFRHVSDAAAWINNDLESYHFTNYKYRIEFDGGARGNPGHAGSGACVKDIHKGITVARGYWYMHHYGTNNLAEIYALYRGLLLFLRFLQFASDFQKSSVLMQGDSSLIIKIMRKVDKVKDDEINTYVQKIASLLNGVPVHDFRWVPREENAEADRLSNYAMDNQDAYEGIKLTGM